MRRLLALLAAALIVGSSAAPALAANRPANDVPAVTAANDVPAVTAAGPVAAAGAEAATGPVAARGPVAAGGHTVSRPVTATGTTAPVTVTLNAMAPRSPDPSKYEQPVVFAVTLTNNTDTSYSDIQLSLQRGLPITQQNLLDNAVSHPPQTDYLVADPLDLQRPLPAHARLSASYRTTVGGMCLCFDGVYPYAVVASAVSDANAGFAEVGRTQVFVPSFQQPPQPVSVGWVWPLLDKPHRSVDSDVFLDESLAGEVGPGGRLDRALQVAELVAGRVRLTLVVDPDLLDSLAVMAKGYRVRKGTGTVPGTGGALAAGWLARFKAVAVQHDVSLTGYADPDVNALTRAGMPFATTLDPQVRARIAPYLDGTPETNSLAWPAGGALTSKALDALVGSGAGTVLLSDTALPGGNQTEPRPDAVSPLPTAAGSATALVTDSGLQATVQRALKLGAAPANDQQTLLARLAIRAAQEPGSKHFVVIAPDRYVDTDPAAAARTIESVIGTGWSAPISLPTALSTVLPADRGALNTAAEKPAAEISPQQLSDLAVVQQRVSSMNEALHDNDASALLLAGFNLGIQRGESSAWRSDRAGGARVTAQLLSRIDSIAGAVHLVQPADGTYSLSSTQSPIVVTVANQLRKPVTVRVVVTPVNSSVGFSAPAYLTETIPARSNETVRIPT
ncbi:MAG TPA: hypothetical protein VFU36_04455, partial [Jatrophihabitans sp.]|nr:hypothetical protein [Jatrophihabitans sp.]